MDVNAKNADEVANKTDTSDVTPSPEESAKPSNQQETSNALPAPKPIFTPKEREFRLLNLEKQMNTNESEGDNAEIPTDKDVSQGQTQTNIPPRKRGRPSNAERAARMAAEGKDIEGRPIEKRTEAQLAVDMGNFFAVGVWPICNTIAHLFGHKFRRLTDSEKDELGRAWEPIARRVYWLAWLSKWIAPLLTLEMLRRTHRKLKRKASEQVVDVQSTVVNEKVQETNVYDMSPTAIASRRNAK